MTQRYTHLRPDLFRASELQALGVDLAPGTAAPTALGARTVPAANEAAEPRGSSKTQAGAAL